MLKYKCICMDTKVTKRLINLNMLRLNLLWN